MKINQLSYYDYKREWKLEPIQFSDINLLVGASGVGKTQILESIINLRQIANGESFNGVSWDIYFTVRSGLKIQWSGSFEKINLIHNVLSKSATSESEQDQSKYKIIRENLCINDEIIVNRNEQNIYFKGQILPKLSSFQSVIYILGEEEDIYPIKKGFNQIQRTIDMVNYDFSRKIMAINLFFERTSFIQKLEEYSHITLENIYEIKLPIQAKLLLVYQRFPEIFNKIKKTFISVFPHVEDMKLELDPEETIEHMKEYPLFKIKEKQVSNWINESYISSGMLKSLEYISKLYLSAEGTIVLIDEFENSLGVNCIDIVTDLILANRNLQFIITSHHPYIINNIGMEHWKIITRKGGVVTARDAKDLNLGKSRHQAFMQLMNLDEYKEGITA